MKDILDLELSQFISMVYGDKTIYSEVIVAEIDGSRTTNKNKSVFPVRLRAHSVVFVCEGEMIINLDYQTHTLCKNSILEIPSENIVENITLSPDFKGFNIIISLNMLIEIIREITPRPSQNIGLLKRLHPKRVLSESMMQNLLESVKRIQRHILNKTHYFHSQIIKTELLAFILELDNELLQHYDTETPIKLSKNDKLRFQFIQLLINNCRTRHDVSFYADQLCVTPDHLSRVMKEISGNSVSTWINHALMIEAKFMLRKSDYNIQQVAEALNFSDQSAFGKFFKRETGQSPSDYIKTSYFNRTETPIIK